MLFQKPPKILVMSAGLPQAGRFLYLLRLDLGFWQLAKGGIGDYEETADVQ